MKKHHLYWFGGAESQIYYSMSWVRRSYPIASVYSIQYPNNMGFTFLFAFQQSVSWSIITVNIYFRNESPTIPINTYWQVIKRSCTFNFRVWIISEVIYVGPGMTGHLEIIQNLMIYY